MAAFSWTGFYVGLNAGYAWSETDASVFVPPGSNINSTARGIANGALNGNVDGNGFTGGGTIGVNHQSGNLVIGLEGDFNYLDIDETRDSGIVGVGTTGRGQDRLEAEWLATLRMRWGYASAATLYYVTAGAAFTDASITRTLDWSFSDPACPVVGGGLRRCHAGSGDFRAGWTVGAGIEHAFTKNWTIKGEYLYADFGDEDFTTVNPTFANQTMDHSFDLNMHIARVGINYKF